MCAFEYACVNMRVYVHVCEYACVCVQDDIERNSIPQVPLFDLLTKFDGLKEKVVFL